MTKELAHCAFHNHRVLRGRYEPHERWSGGRQRVQGFIMMWLLVYTHGEMRVLWCARCARDCSERSGEGSSLLLKQRGACIGEHDGVARDELRCPINLELCLNNQGCYHVLESTGDLLL